MSRLVGIPRCRVNVSAWSAVALQNGCSNCPPTPPRVGKSPKNITQPLTYMVLALQGGLFKRDFSNQFEDPHSISVQTCTFRDILGVCRNLLHSLMLQS